MNELRAEAVLTMPNVVDAVRAVPGLRDRLACGIDVLDVGRDGGESMVALAAAFPRSRFLGIAPDAATVARARRRTIERRLRNAYWVTLAAHQLAPLPTYDLVCVFAGLLDTAEPRAAMRAIHAAIAADGVALWSEPRAADHHGGVRALASETGFARIEPLTVDDALHRFFVLRK